jgi:hypothetical protein
MAEFHRKTRGIGFLHRCLLTMTFHSLVLFYWECSHRGIDRRLLSTVVCNFDTL